jgi:Tol biopolymer transport system component
VGNNYDASVSRTGKTLVFISDRSGTPSIWTMDLENGNAQMLSKATGEPVPQLSPDGRWVVFTAIGARHWITLWKMPVSGGQAVELNDRFWSRPVISPDGNWIAGFYADTQLNTQTIPTSIAIISSNGGPIRNVFHIPLSVLVPGGIRWSRDGRELCYISSGKEGANILAQPVLGGAPHQITHFKGIDLFSFDWSEDGKQLVFSRGFQARDVVLVKDARQR